MRALATVLSLLTLAVSLHAQQAAAPHGWAFGAGGILIVRPSADYNLAGPAVQISRVVPRGVGFDVRLARTLPAGPYDWQGLSAILGLSYGLPFDAHLFQVRGGVTALGGTDVDGGSGGEGGLYVGGSVLFRLGPHIGVHLETLGRFYSRTSRSDLTPSVAGALLVLPHGS